MTAGHIGQDQRRPGRPRSERSRTAVLRATAELTHEVGLRAMAIEEIASRSGTIKVTIYKWWPNKYAVAVEAFLSEMFAESTDPETGSAHEDFRVALRGLVHFYASPSGRVFAQLVAEAQFDPAVAVNLVFGPAMYRLVARHVPLDAADDEIVEMAYARPGSLRPASLAGRERTGDPGQWTD